jgi:flavin reductase (DIM6/NTAB) family NADH-FMN oxidoreductase RutF
MSHEVGGHANWRPAQSPTIPRIDSAVFRSVIGAVTSGVIVLTARDQAGNHGMTISALSSVSLEPPMLLVCLNMSSRTQKAVQETRNFAVHVLDTDQAWIAHRFAKPSNQDKFRGIRTCSGMASVPILPEALAVLECRVDQQVVAGTHSVFIANVLRAHARDGSPLAYFRGRFGRFELVEDAS